MANKIQACLIACFALYVCSAAHAIVTIEIDQGVKRGVPIAVVPFGGTDNLELDFTVDEVIRSDLSRTGRFEAIPPSEFISFPTNVQDVKFNDWKLIDADYLLIGDVSKTSENEFQIVTRLFDTLEGKQIYGVQFKVAADQVRGTSHAISNAVHENITDKQSSFHTRIAYTTTVAGDDGDLQNRLYVADYDGYNALELLRGSAPILSPTWSPDSRYLAYSVLHDEGSRIFIQEISTGNRFELIQAEGHFRAPSWSFDGKSIAFSRYLSGNSDLFVYVLESGESRRLTRHRLIDTEPTWSPDGNHIVFTSNRAKGVQLYRIPTAAGVGDESAQRIQIDGESNTGAHYSVEGDSLVFITSQEGGRRVAVYDFETQTSRVVSPTFIDDSATISPYGDMIMYIVEGSDRHIRLLARSGQVHSRIEVEAGRVKQVVWQKAKQ